jgi:hypothetical protein
MMKRHMMVVIMQSERWSLNKHPKYVTVISGLAYTELTQWEAV